MTHCIAASVVRRSLSIFGSATLTTDSSMNASVEPSTATASTQDLTSAQPGTLGLERIATSPHGSALGLLT